jgi:hypothetical protein
MDLASYAGNSSHTLDSYTVHDPHSRNSPLLSLTLDKGDFFYLPSET